ncbi:uncharacterized protein at1g76660 [Phtheirospermum japonicum]|uniref:Uncharacterized protein at1g76660 n=1 Tax=Phtheirospermum japonicum TaxID=374723 RepID=A0A830BV65_9LAMI|nr:uncharacterized protein at1g76660 [Phtheirospermum japonicum]
MSSVHNSVETVNAAATAIVTAESRVQPSTVQKKRWRSCWSIYHCFGSHKQTKKIGHAVLISEPSAPRTLTPLSENRNPSSSSSSIVIPFIAPPSSPPPPPIRPSLRHQLPWRTTLPFRHSPGGPASIFAIGPYAHETQLVSPPVFSTFTTEPSTASFTPPPEPVQMTTPSSPEVPFAQLLSSSLARTRRNSGPYSKLPLSQYEFQPYQYPDSKSPGSAVSTSGTSSPFFTDRRAVLEFRMGEAPKFLGYENYKWDSRVGSGSMTPNDWGSRVGSGARTPNGPNGGDNNDNKVASSNRKSQNDDLVDHRVSFELFGEEIPTCIVRAPSLKKIEEGPDEKDLGSKNEDSFREHFNGETMNEEEFQQKHRTISLGSSKDFNFNNENGEVCEKSSVDCEWWVNEKGVKKELGPRNSWSFFPMLQSGAS